MTRVALKTKYESEPEPGSGTLTVGAGELKLKALYSDWTFLYGVNSLRGISLGIEKPVLHQNMGMSNTPSYDFQSQSWHFGIGHEFGNHDHAKAVYDGHNKNLGLEWTRESKEYGHFKVTATVPAKDYKLAKMVAEKTWSVNI
ncbi:unnamed protein product [Sphagnum balticum]